MKRLFKNSKGFTVSELTISATIFGFMSLSLMFFTHSFNTLRYELQSRSKLTTDAKTAVEQIVWGLKTAGQTARDGIWEARSFNIVSANDLQYTDTAGIVHEVRQSGLKIQYRSNGGAWFTLYDPNGAAADDANKNSTILTFLETDQTNVVEIRLVLGERNLGRWDHVSASTKVAFRN
jgi:hypothetical protein